MLKMNEKRLNKRRKLLDTFSQNDKPNKPLRIFFFHYLREFYVNSMDCFSETETRS